MKKVLITAAALAFMAISFKASAQDDNEKSEKSKKQSQEIIIRKKGDQDSKITVEINGDKVTINGKPLADYKDDNITINSKKVTVMDRHGNKEMEFFPGDFGGVTINGMGMADDKPHAFLGVTTESTDDGAKITEVSKESAAEKAGLKEGDIITKVGDTKVDGPTALSDAIMAKQPKDEVKITYKRDGKEKSDRIVLGESKGTAMAYSFNMPDEKIVRGYSMPKMNYSYSMPKVQGFNRDDNQSWSNGNEFKVFGDMYPRQRLGLKIQDTEDGTGVKVIGVEKDSPAEKAGLQKDDILTEVGGKKVTNTDEARNELRENADKSAYNLKAMRNNSAMSFDIKIPKKLKTADL